MSEQSKKQEELEALHKRMDRIEEGLNALHERIDELTGESTPMVRNRIMARRERWRQEAKGES